jgi:hypothetical protein
MSYFDDTHPLGQERTRNLILGSRSTNADWLEFADGRRDTHERMLRQPRRLAPAVGPLGHV